MNLTETIVPKSDQLNADDLMAGPVTVTIKDVRSGNPEQPVDVILEEFPGRAYRPSKSMRRVMVMCWGAEAANYVGHRLTLYRNPDIMFGPNKVGGIEISHMSHIEKATTIALTAKRGSRKAFTVQPLATEAPKPSRDWAAELKLAGDDLDALAALGKAASNAHADDSIVDAIRAEFVRARDAQVQG